MATRLKTVEYWFPYLSAGFVDATDTNLTQITIYLPESSKSFKSVFADVIVHDRNTTVSNISRRQVSIQLGSAGYSEINNTNTLTSGGEQQTIHFSGDFTSYFTTNWSGTSMTCDCRLLLDSAATTPLNPSFVNASVKLVITYEYDNTSSTHVKTVHIPLNAPITGLTSSKPGSATDTIPNLDSYCPEASKTFRQLTIVVQGNTEGGSTTDKSLSFEVDTLGAFTSYLYEHGSNCDMWYRLNQVVSFTTNATHSFYIWASTTDFDHPQVWLAVTYEFSPSSSTTILNSLWLPMEFSGAMGGPTSSDYQRGSRELWIQEPTTITLQRLALFVFYDKMGAQTGLYTRVGTGSFLNYSDVASVLSGGAGLMIRNDGAFSLSRGRNTLTADIYNTNTTNIGYNLSSVWLVNYTSGKATSGVGAHNHTVEWNIKTTGTVAASVQTLVSATAPAIPESNYFISGIGIHYVYTSNGQGNPMGVHVGVERLSGEGGIVWENAYEGFGGTDSEVGIRQIFAQTRDIFYRWAVGERKDRDTTRLDLEVSRRWRLDVGGACASFDHATLYITYHDIEFTVSDSVSGSGGGSVTLNLCRDATGEQVLQLSRTGNGTFTFTWFDNTEDVYVEAYEDSTHMGRSDSGTATGSP